MSKVLLLLGSNFGDREGWLSFARQKLESSFGLIVRSTSVVETAPWGYESPNAYLNQIVEVETSLDPLKILDRTQGIELSAGRRHTKEGYEDRTLDIDILYIDDLEVDHPRLKVPHPRISDRPFVLALLDELK